MPIDVVHYCKWEPNNPKDECAVAIYADSECRRRVAYFRREDSAVLHTLFKEHLLEGPCYVKAKHPVSKFSIQKGPMQSISIGFKCCDAKVEVIRNMTERFETRIY